MEKLIGWVAYGFAPKPFFYPRHLTRMPHNASGGIKPTDTP